MTTDFSIGSMLISANMRNGCYYQRIRVLLKNRVPCVIRYASVMIAPSVLVSGTDKPLSWHNKNKYYGIGGLSDVAGSYDRLTIHA
jgi:hypothetical protein